MQPNFNCQLKHTYLPYVDTQLHPLHMTSWIFTKFTFNVIPEISSFSCLIYVSIIPSLFSPHIYDLILILRYNNIVVNIVVNIVLILNCQHRTKFLHTQHSYVHSEHSQVDIWTYLLSMRTFASSCIPDIQSSTQWMHILKFMHTWHPVICSMCTISSSCIPNIWSYAACILYVDISVHSQKPCKVNIMQHVFSKLI